MGKYQKPKSSSDKDDKKDEGTFVKFEVPLNNLDDKSDKYERKVKIFSDGKPFDWCEFRENTDDLFDVFGCTSPSQDATNKRHHLYIALFTGRAKSLYIANFNKINSANAAKPSEEQSNDCDILNMVINETAKSFFCSWDTAIQEQKQYMRQNLFLGDTIPSVFIKQLKRMNKFLKFFPRADTSLTEDKILIEEEQLITIVHHASHGIMQLQIQRSGKTINEFQTLDALKVFFDKQHECDLLEKRLLHDDDNKKSDKKKKGGRNHKKSKKHDNNSDDKAENGDRKPSAKPKCPICGKIGHREDNCWSSEKNAKKREAASQSANPILKKIKIRHHDLFCYHRSSLYRRASVSDDDEECHGFSEREVWQQ
jgi:hypothetical protein